MAAGSAGSGPSFGPPVRSPEGFVPLRQYAAIGDGRTVALIAADGDIDWLPIPDLAAPPVFSALLDPVRGGRVTMRPSGPARLRRRYIEGTNVLLTTVSTPDGEAEVVDSLNSGVAGRLPWTELARRVRGLRGRVRFEWSVEPGDMWRTRSVRSADDGVLRIGAVQLAVVGTDHGAQWADRRVTGRFRTDEASEHLVAVVGTHDEPVPVPDPAHVNDRIDLTVRSWTTWSEACEISDVDGQLLRNALALKLLVHSPTGTIAAAATTSLPESPAGGKNWDYRFSWLRDTAFAVNALARLGIREEVHAATTRLLAGLRRDGPVPYAFTTLAGNAPSGQRPADAPGWRGIGPVVSGNDAADQLQLGVFGDLFSLVDAYLGAGHRLDPESDRLLSDMATRCCEMWRLTDAGLWELPELRHYTSSKMGCWQALSIAVRLAAAGHLSGPADRWQREADQVAAFIDRECWSESLQAFTFHAGSEELDASVLLGVGFDSGPRMSSTIDVLRRRLGVGPLLYRYSGMAAEEHCFVACSFWAVGALARVGRRADAQELMDALRPLTNDVGLLAEMIDPATGEFWGNLPQALSHLTMIDAQLTLLEATATGGPSGSAGFDDPAGRAQDQE